MGTRAGETGSGSSSCAVFAVSHRLKKVGDQVQAHMPGGILHLSMKENHVFMRGSVTEVGYVELTSSFFRRKNRYHQHKTSKLI